MDKPRVKPLEWRVDDSQNEYAQAQYSVDRYCIEHRLHADDAFDLWIGPDATTATRFPTLEAAKAAAQADYEARILAALEPVTVQRCAECDCENPPDECNWIAAEPAPVTVQEAARVLLEKWTAGEFEDSADAVADDAITDQWAHVDRTFPDAGMVIEAWLRALAEMGE